MDGQQNQSVTFTAIPQRSRGRCESKIAHTRPPPLLCGASVQCALCMFRAPLLQRQRITPGVLARPRPASPLRWLSMLCSRAGHSLSRTHAVGSRARIRRRLLFACLALAALLLWSLLYSLAPRRYPPVLAGVKRLQLPAGLPEAPSRGTVEVVVSRYRDDLDWLPALAQLLRANVTVYCKARGAFGAPGSPSADARLAPAPRSRAPRRPARLAPRRCPTWATRATAIYTTWWSATTA